VLRALDRDAEYLAAVRAFADRHGADPLVEAALNDLGTYYILADDDERAAEVFREQYERFPLGAFADRAAWKAGWWAYKQRDHAAATRLFESAAAGLRRSDYRPAWLYWAARARERGGDPASAASAHRRVVTDYRNSFYGRQSLAELARLAKSGTAPSVAPAGDAALTSWSIVAPGARPANGRLIQRLLAVGLYDDAILEVRRLQRTVGASPFLDATIGFALHRKGEWRPAITALRRAYPQFMAAGGERLPADLLRMIFPLDHWDLIRKYAAQHDLDPYLMAALMCQESTFQADVRSPANAWGLMQIVPATGRRYAQRLGIKSFSTTRLTNSEVNIRIGMAYFADLRDRFGGVADALAAYNAGENRLIRWRAERPEAPLDEFIDDIPFPETQHYVKRVLGTAEDYRLLYGPPAGRQAASR
jgi:soluble lytic murein transglycosylase